jgi:hypothetical protein
MVFHRQLQGFRDLPLAQEAPWVRDKQLPGNFAIRPPDLVGSTIVHIDLSRKLRSLIDCGFA